MANLLTLQVDATGLKGALQSLGPAIDRRLLEVCRFTAEGIVADARVFVHKDTGITADSIIDTADGSKGYLVTVQRHPLPNLPVWLEFGTVHGSAEHFFGQAVEAEEPLFNQRLAQAVQDAIDAAGFERVA